MLPRAEVIELYTHAARLLLPVGLRAVRHHQPGGDGLRDAVVASAVGGIKEVVVPEETGLLVDPHLNPGTFEPVDPGLLARPRSRDQPRRARPGHRAPLWEQGRQRAEEHFSWDAIADETLALYRSLLNQPKT